MNWLEALISKRGRRAPVDPAGVVDLEYFIWLFSRDKERNFNVWSAVHKKTNLARLWKMHCNTLATLILYSFATIRPSISVACFSIFNYFFSFNINWLAYTCLHCTWQPRISCLYADSLADTAENGAFNAASCSRLECDGTHILSITDWSTRRARTQCPRLRADVGDPLFAVECAKKRTALFDPFSERFRLQSESPKSVRNCKLAQSFLNPNALIWSNQYVVISDTVILFMIIFQRTHSDWITFFVDVSCGSFGAGTCTLLKTISRKCRRLWESRGKRSWDDRAYHVVLGFSLLDSEHCKAR